MRRAGIARSLGQPHRNLGIAPVVHRIMHRRLRWGGEDRPRHRARRTAAERSSCPRSASTLICGISGSASSSLAGGRVDRRIAQMQHGCGVDMGQRDLAIESLGTGRSLAVMGQRAGGIAQGLIGAALPIFGRAICRSAARPRHPASGNRPAPRPAPSGIARR